MKARRLITIALGLAALVFIGWLVWFLFLQSPADEMARAQDKLLRAVEQRDWDEIKAMLTDDYMDDFGHDRDTAIETGKQLLSGFFAITLDTETTWCKGTDEVGVVKMKIRMSGTGAGFSQEVMSRVNRVKEPWVFHWHHKGNWPWDWKVVQIQQEDLP